MSRFQQRLAEALRDPEVAAGYEEGEREAAIQGLHDFLTREDLPAWATYLGEEIQRLLVIDAAARLVADTSRWEDCGHTTRPALGDVAILAAALGVFCT